MLEQTTSILAAMDCSAASTYLAICPGSYQRPSNITGHPSHCHSRYCTWRHDHANRQRLRSNSSCFFETVCTHSSPANESHTCYRHLSCGSVLCKSCNVASISLGLFGQPPRPLRSSLRDTYICMKFTIRTCGPAKRKDLRGHSPAQSNSPTRRELLTHSIHVSLIKI